MSASAAASKFSLTAFCQKVKNEFTTTMAMLMLIMATMMTTMVMLMKIMVTKNAICRSAELHIADFLFNHHRSVPSQHNGDFTYQHL